MTNDMTGTNGEMLLKLLLDPDTVGEAKNVPASDRALHERFRQWLRESPDTHLQTSATIWLVMAVVLQHPPTLQFWLEEGVRMGVLGGALLERAPGTTVN